MMMLLLLLLLLQYCCHHPRADTWNKHRACLKSLKMMREYPRPFLSPPLPLLMLKTMRFVLLPEVLRLQRRRQTLVGRLALSMLPLTNSREVLSILVLLLLVVVMT